MKLTPEAGNTKGGSITVLLTSCLTGLNESVLQIKTKIVSCHTADSKPVKQEVSSTVIPPPLVFPARGIEESFMKLSPALGIDNHVGLPLQEPSRRNFLFLGSALNVLFLAVL